MKTSQPNCILPNIFFEGREIPNVHPDSLDAIQWWEEQLDRSVNGFKYGGFELTGDHYFHLNFIKINMIDSIKRPYMGNPYYSFEDEETFGYINQAEKLGKAFMMITGRGHGKSYNIATPCIKRFSLFELAEIIVSASDKLAIDLLYAKILNGINHLPSAIKPSLLHSNKTETESGVEETYEGQSTITGLRSIVRKIIYGNDPAKTKGTRPMIHVFEEIGSWLGAAKLADCYTTTSASWWRGANFTCLPLLIGTGGQMKTGGSEDARKMAYNPEAFNLISFIQGDRKQCYFVPAFKKFEGFYEDTGISNQEGAKEFLIARRESKKGDLKVYNQEVQEFPFTLEEAFYLSGSNTFDTDKLYKQVNRIKTTPQLEKKVQRGNLHFVKDGSRILGVKWEQDPKGVIELIEHPQHLLDKKTDPYINLYVSGCDSYDSYATDGNEGEETRSKGSIYIRKRFLNARTTSNLFVAKCTLRNRDSDDFYLETLKLNMYYNAQMLFEHTKIGILKYYMNMKMLHFLMKKPKIAYQDVKDSRSNNTYGLAMPEKIKYFVIDKYADEIKSNSEEMYFLSQLEDAINFRFGSSKFDETMASALAVVADDELHDILVKEKKKESRFKAPVFYTDATGKMVFG